MKAEKTSLKGELVETALAMGAVGARVATREMLAGPPSADPSYVLPEGRSVVAYAVSLGKNWIPDYFEKRRRDVFADIMYDKYQLVGAIGRALVEISEKRGFTALSPQPNGVYRPEYAKGKLLVPDFSHRYAALASGLGTLGWSGNVLVEGHWAAVFLGSVITEADLPSDEPLEENLCDGCRICTKVCPLGFIDAKAAQVTNLGGHEFSCSKKGNHMRCALACSGLVGISQAGKWSTWATLRYRVPDDDEKLAGAFVAALKDPDAEYIRNHVFSEAFRKGVLFRSRRDTQPTCCNCALVCCGPMEQRKELMRILHASGVVVRLPDGSEKAVAPETLDPLFTRDFTNERGSSDG